MQPDVVEKIVGLREGIPRKDAKEVTTLPQKDKEKSKTDNRIHTRV